MNSQTMTRLIAINRRFYDRFAGEFSATRQHPWRGWDRVLRCLPHGPLSVLDVGCGNGRFGAYLTSRRRSELRYVGLDGSPRLLAEARTRLSDAAAPVDSRFELFEIFSQRLQDLLAGESFRMVALFGVLHHVPGSDLRRRLLADCASVLEPGGILAVTLWRLDRNPGFAQKTLSWTGYNAAVERRLRRGETGCEQAPAIDVEELETGDYLLTWNGDADTPRYCHFPDGSEIDGWLRGSGLRTLERFDADGATGADNHYLLLTP